MLREDVLQGRGAECAALGQLLTGVRDGRSQVLVVRGHAGIGKSALLRYAAKSATGCRVEHVTGIEYEMELPFAGVHQLCAPLLGLLDRLPDPQRDALETAFGLGAKAPADRFVVALAVLSLLSEAAAEQPLLCVIEDAQWLDTASALTIAFVARRLQAESIGLLFAVREPGEVRELEGLPELRLAGLGDRDARELLESAWPGRLDEEVRDRVIAEARGNPLALLELPRDLSPADLAGGFELPNAAQLADRIEQSFLRQLELLPEDTRQLLLFAAAEPVGDHALLWRAASHVGLGEDVVVAAQDAGLIELGGRVRFRHPLVRSAVYQAASVAERHEVHRVLAEVTDAETDPDRRAWHRGHATASPDESVAFDLARSARRARARGGIAAAAAFLERAAALSPDSGTRGRRALAAAQARFESGALDKALDLLAIADASHLPEPQRARLALLRARITYARTRGNEAPPLLLDAARLLEVHEPAASRESYLEAVGAAIFAGRLGIRVSLREVAIAARGAPPGSHPPRATDLLLDGLATRLTDGYVAGATPLRRAVAAFDGGPRADEDEFVRWFWLPWLTAAELWDDTSWQALATRAVGLCRASGALFQLPLALGYLALTHVHAGEFAAADTLIAEGDAIAEAIGGAPVAFPAGLLSGWRGRHDQGFWEWGMVNVIGRGEGRGIGGGGLWRAILFNGLGRYDKALAHARTACQFEDFGIFGFILVELVEAAVRTGGHDEAADALGRLEERTSAAGTDWALGVAARSRALLSDGPAAEALYREAIERLGRTRISVHEARAHLVFGEWLRRENRRIDAREQLRTAYELFTRFGMEAFATRARRELQATGETLRSGDAANAVLTHQESQIAQLAREGSSNPEIAAALFISRHTVEWHLKHVFVKLDITSRNQLARLPLSRLSPT